MTCRFYFIPEGFFLIKMSSKVCFYFTKPFSQLFYFIMSLLFKSLSVNQDQQTTANYVTGTKVTKQQPIKTAGTK